MNTPSTDQPSQCALSDMCRAGDCAQATTLPLLVSRGHHSAALAHDVCDTDHDNDDQGQRL